MPIDIQAGHNQVQDWGSRVTTYLRSEVFKKTTACCLMLVLYLVVGHAIEDYAGYRLVLPKNDTTLFGAALSILMVLRTNSAYDRWWEGRKLWGSLVNTTRNLSLKIDTLTLASPEEKALIGRYIILFPQALRDHLRAGILPETLAKFPEAPPERIRHYPQYLSGQVGRILNNWRQEKKVQDLDLHLLDGLVSELMNVCGACERIRNTPLPLAHRALIPQLLGLYLMVVPLSLDLTVGSYFFIMGIGYFLIGLELVAEEIEEPFGTDDDDLQLDAICRNIEKSILEVLPLKVDATPI